MMHLHGRTMKALLKLFRWQNLVIIILTQVLVRYALIAPLLGQMGLELQLPLMDFIILVFATVCITAGGYVINDYFDIKTDLVNRGSVIVGTKIPRRKAMMWHNVLNVMGVCAGFWISFRIGYFWAGIMFLLISGLLYFYSAAYKKQLLIGNLIVALLTSLLPLMVALYEIPAVYNYYGNEQISLSQLMIPLQWVTGMAVFAFLTSLTQEIIKDMEDFEGDKAYGSRSLPVVAGINMTKIFVAVILMITIVLLFLVWIRYLTDIMSLLYILITLILPLLLISLMVLRSKSIEEFNKANRYIKIVMLAGISYTVLLWLILERGLTL